MNNKWLRVGNNYMRVDHIVAIIPYGAGTAVLLKSQVEPVVLDFIQPDMLFRDMLYTDLTLDEWKEFIAKQNSEGSGNVESWRGRPIETINEAADSERVCERAVAV